MHLRRDLFTYEWHIENMSIASSGCKIPWGPFFNILLRVANAFSRACSFYEWILVWDQF
jgi:hypothetical protein